MANDERARVALYERLDETLGRGPADTLMAYLPPVGWADVATKHDLAVLELRMEGMEARLEARFERALRQVMLAMVTTTIASVGAAVGLTQLLG